MGKEKEGSKTSERKGGLCCDHCSDSKFPCVFMENKMKRESKDKAGAEPDNNED